MSAGTEADSAVIGPGATIGIIGGGQLGRMMAMAAAQLGYRTHIYAPESSGPAFEVSTHWTQGAYDDADALGRFADQCAVVTYEFENLPAAPIAALAKQVPLRPNGRPDVEKQRVNVDAVRNAVISATEAGWNPTSRGKPMVFDVDADGH